ncbi:TIGR04282 family arsenosugar biosynthesis glycosyltransferase [Cryobacterium sp. AP23]
MTTLIVIAKECLPGKVKTRLHPPLSLEQAAQLAAASLDDTLAAVATLPATRRVLAFDGQVAPAAAAGYDIVPQVHGGLDERLGAIFDGCTEPAVLIGMDTPQVSAAVLAPIFTAWPDDVDAWFGPAADGGFWALALRHPDGDLIRGVPMSRDDTGQRQLERLRAAGLRVRLLPTLTDVDHIEDAHEVAALAPDGRFAATLAGFGAPLLSGAGR